MKELTINEVKAVSGARGFDSGDFSTISGMAGAAFGNKYFPAWRFAGTFWPGLAAWAFVRFVAEPQINMTKQDVQNLGQNYIDRVNRGEYVPD